MTLRRCRDGPSNQERTTNQTTIWSRFNALYITQNRDPVHKRGPRTNGRQFPHRRDQYSSTALFHLQSLCFQPLLKAGLYGTDRRLTLYGVDRTVTATRDRVHLSHPNVAKVEAQNRNPHCAFNPAGIGR